MPAPRRLDKPLSLTKQLATHARVRPVNNKVGVGTYYHSAQLLLRQINTYRSAGDDVQLYVFLMRYVSLLLETMRQHQDFRKTDPTYQRFYQKILDGQYMEELETIKRRLDMKDPPTENRYRMNTRPAEAVQTSLTNLPGLDWAALTPSYRSGSYGGGSGYGGGSNASSNGQQQLVSGLQSMDLLSGVRPASSAQQLPPNLLPFDAQGASWLPMASSDARQRHALLPSAPKRRRPMAEQLPASQRPLYPAFDASPLSPIDFGFQDAAPSAPPLNGAAANGRQQQPPSLMDSSLAEAAPSPPPAPAQLTADLQQQVANNVKPQLSLQLGPQEMPVDMVSPTEGDPCCAPQHAQSPLEKDFEGIRDVNVSVSLMEDFMRLCVSNTQRNIETIGLLGGTLSKDGTSFTIDTLIIPKQKGETDRVEMLKEEEIWDIFFRDGAAATQSLFPVGWIHTHPAFDCFLSSVDIHNQYGYQVMLEEAVAIVMSPRDSQNRKCGIFRLTTPGGMGLIKDCSQTGFHTHPPTRTGQKIYELCGHVYVNPRVQHKVVDLRT